MIIAKNYAKALFQSVKPKKLDSVKILLNFSQILTNSGKSRVETHESLLEELCLLTSYLEFLPEVFEAYKSPLYPESEKLETLFIIFPGLSNKIKSFLQLLTERNSLYLIPEVSREYEKAVNTLKSITQVKLTIAGSLSDNEKVGEKYLNIFRNLTSSKNIRLKLFYNPKILGGFVLEYNSLAIDASIIRELESILF